MRNHPFRGHRPHVLIAGTAIVLGLMAFEAAQEKAPVDLPDGLPKGVPTSDFANFESPHVHPLDMTPDQSRLLAVNTGNNALEVFAIMPHGLLHERSITVGVDPVTVRARSNSEAWVVNRISDDVSIVDLNTGVVVRTLSVEDEPADVVFAGGKAFVS